MSVPASRRHQFSLWQLLVILTAICVLLALAAPILRPIIANYGYFSLILVPPVLFLLFFAFVVIRLGLPVLESDSTKHAVRAEAYSHGIGWIGLLAYFCIAAPEFEHLCKQWDMVVPGSGRWVFRISHAVTGYSYFCVPLVASLIVGDCRVLALLHRVERNRWLARAWSKMITLCLVAMMAFSLWALVRVPFGIAINLERTEYPF